ncbi:MAG: VOC family protein [Gammaproteobacteria bacterium]|nr:VOC family protein [Gammaproteobacteria bacterium]
MTDAIAHVTVGVADLERALDLWQGTFGMEVAAHRNGPDAGLARLWDIGPERIMAQAMLRSPGTRAGWLHFVQFAEPDAPVREGAGSMDLGPKNLDVYCDDIRARVAALEADGWGFKSRVIDYNVGDVQASEVQMPGPDETNIVFVEVAGESMPVSSKGYCGLTSFVVIVPDIETEAAFYRDTFGFDELLRHRITGEGIEEIVNLPSSTGVEMSVLGREQERFGRVELIQYDNSPGIDRFGLAKAPARGSLHCAFRVASVADVLEACPGDSRRIDGVDTLFTDGPIGILTTPAGLRVEIFE